MVLSSRGGVRRAVTSLGAATSPSVLSTEMPIKCTDIMAVSRANKSSMVCYCCFFN